VVVSDADRVIEDFHNTKLWRPAPGEDDYNLSGKVQKVNVELAQRYLEMKAVVKR